MTKLSILICTLPKRKEYFDSLYRQLEKQITKTGAFGEVEVSFLASESMSIGEKRNELLLLAEGEYICFIDDDDKVSPGYIHTILEALESNPDCLSLKGIMTTDGKNPEVFEHSLKYQRWHDNGASYPSVRYERYPNHLNVIRSSIAKQFTFHEKNHGEDFDWSTQLHNSGLLKTEVYIDEVLYYYQYLTKKP